MGIDRNRELCTIDDVLETFKQSTPRSKSAAERAVGFLQEQGVFPLTYSNPILAPLNVLGLLVYFTGTLRVNNDDSYRATISCSGNHAEDVFPTLEKALNVSISPFGKYHKLGNTGSSYARLLSAIGYSSVSGTRLSRETKAKIGTSIPDYLTHLLSEWDGTSGKDREVCGKYIRDFLSTIIDTKGRYSNRAFVINTLYQPTEELVRKQIMHLKSAFRCSYSDIVNPDEWNYTVTGSNKSLGGKLLIPVEDVHKLATQTQLPIALAVQQTTPRYGF